MKRKEIVEHIAQKHEISQVEAKRYVKKMVKLMSEKLKQDNAFALPGLGTFDTHIRKGRKYYMPWKKLHYFVPKKRVVQFHPSGQLKENMKYNKLRR